VLPVRRCLPTSAIPTGPTVNPTHPSVTISPHFAPLHPCCPTTSPDARLSLRLQRAARALRAGGRDQARGLRARATAGRGGQAHDQHRRAAPRPPRSPRASCRVEGSSAAGCAPRDRGGPGGAASAGRDGRDACVPVAQRGRARGRQRALAGRARLCANTDAGCRGGRGRRGAARARDAGVAGRGCAGPNGERRALVRRELGQERRRPAGPAAPRPAARSPSAEPGTTAGCQQCHHRLGSTAPAPRTGSGRRPGPPLADADDLAPPTVTSPDPARRSRRAATSPCAASRPRAPGAFDPHAASVAAHVAPSQWRRAPRRRPIADRRGQITSTQSTPPGSSSTAPPPLRRARCRCPRGIGRTTRVELRRAEHERRRLGVRIHTSRRPASALSARAARPPDRRGEPPPTSTGFGQVRLPDLGLPHRQR
jgi:hypothetical protein